MAESSEVTEEGRTTEDAGVKATLGAKGASVEGTSASSIATGRTSRFKETKLDALERHLQDYKKVLHAGIGKSDFEYGAVIVDDFYLIHPSLQPDVIDYLHRLLRGTDLYLKVGTVRHRTELVRHEGQTVGVELQQDVEEINLDRTFENVSATQDYLSQMLDSMAAKVGIPELHTNYISSDGLLALTLASGGVPRDYLTIFVEGVVAARALNALKWLTPRTVYKGASRVSYRTKLQNLRVDIGSDAEELERAFRDLAAFCLIEKRKTAFLVAQGEVPDHADEHELIKSLMDFKLIHIIEPDTSAASGRSGRYEAYTLDFSLFMEPRLRGIEHVRFWSTDDQRRREGVREAPVYELSRLRGILERPAQPTEPTTETLLTKIESDTGTEEVSDSVAGE